MTKSNIIPAVMLGAAAGGALIKFLYMPKEEKDALVSHVKTRTFNLLDEAETTVEKIEQSIEKVKEIEKEKWVDKVHVFKRLLQELYSFEKKTLNY